MSSFIDAQKKLQVSAGQAGVCWTGQAGFVFKDSQGLIYHIDPYLSDVCSKHIGYHRAVPAPVEAEDVMAGFVMITHDHHDHLDDESIPVIAKTNPDSVFIGPPSCISCFLELGIPPGRLVTIRRRQTKEVGNISLKAAMAHHTDDSVGYVLRVGDLVFYITGDTTYSDDLIEVAGDVQPDVIMACMNGRLGCMNIPDAARLTAHIQPEYAVPMHHGMFKENTADPKEFVRQVEAYSGITKGTILKQGEWYLFSRERGFVLGK